MKSALIVTIAAAGMAMFTAGTAMAHGEHRSCEEGRYGWHRHVGAYGQHRISCERSYRPYREHCEVVCKRVGPFRIKKCRKVCD